MMPDLDPAHVPSHSRWSRLARIAIALGFAAIAASAVLFLLVLRDGSSYKGVGDAADIGPGIGALQGPPVPATATAPASSAEISRFVIPRFGVEAPVIVLGVDGEGAMETPEGPWEVAWYDFTSRPGVGSNAVFAGHVDSNFTGRIGPAVFYHLKDLNEGDTLEVELADGTKYSYRVFNRYSVDAETADVAQIVGPTQREVITLITCGGTRGTQYEERLIVQAERAADGAGQTAAAR